MKKCTPGSGREITLKLKGCVVAILEWLYCSGLDALHVFCERVNHQAVGDDRPRRRDANPVRGERRRKKFLLGYDHDRHKSEKLFRKTRLCEIVSCQNWLARSIIQHCLTTAALRLYALFTPQARHAFKLLFTATLGSISEDFREN